MAEEKVQEENLQEKKRQEDIKELNEKTAKDVSVGKNSINFDKFHSIPVKEWDSHDGGLEYKQYLKKTDKSKLTLDQKDDLKKLEDYENGIGKEEGENSFEFDEEKVDYSRMKTHYGIAFFLSLEDFPKWCLSEVNLHTRNCVISMHKTKSISKIIEIATKKAAKQAEVKAEEKERKKQNRLFGFGRKEEESEENKEESSEKPKEQPKTTLFTIITKGLDGKNKLSNREMNEENDLHSTVEKYVEENNKHSNELISKETSEDLEKKAQQILNDEQQMQ